jgi:hypothetical protein
LDQAQLLRSLRIIYKIGLARRSAEIPHLLSKGRGNEPAGQCITKIATERLRNDERPVRTDKQTLQITAQNGGEEQRGTRRSRALMGKAGAKLIST